MAQLIRPNVKPQKWLLNRQYDRTLINELLSEKKCLIAKRKLALLAHGRRLARSSVKDYCLSKDTYKNAGYCHSGRRFKANLVIKTIILIVEWQKNIKKEAHAIETLAQKIAANITNSQSPPKDLASRRDMIEVELDRLISWYITAPKNISHELNIHYQHLATRLKQDTMLKTHQDNHGAQLCINAFNSSLVFDFCDADIDKILNSVQNQLLSQ